jgi:hypothetical protein
MSSIIGVQLPHTVATFTRGLEPVFKRRSYIDSLLDTEESRL